MPTEFATQWEKQLENFSEFANAMLVAWKVPGMAVAVVKEGEVIFAEGFGKRDLEQDLPATPETLFAIGSCTKAFTAVAMGILVDEGKLDWDQPVRNYLPSFKMFDTFSSERMTPRDLVTHRSGLPRHDLMWYNSPRTRQEIFERLQYLEPSKDFRSVYQYQNLMYMTAGYLVGQISGQGWEAFVQQRILEPLGMVGSNFSVLKSQESPDFSLPFQEKDGRVQAIPFRNIDTVGPAGSINSNVTDMSQWLLLNLNKGRHGQAHIISEGNLSQIHSPQMVIQEPLKYAEILHASYGLGWAIQPYRGHLMIQHGGGIDGFSALTSFLPQAKLGVVVLTNLNGTPLPSIITYNLYDRLLNLDPIPWSDRFKKDDDEIKAAAKKSKEKTASQRQTGTQPSHPLADYAGDFEHPGYGLFSVGLEGNDLKVIFNSMSFPLEHYHYDIFELTWELFDTRLKVSFFTDVKGNIQRLSVPLEPAVDEIVFTRIADKRMKEKRFLEQFTGTYELLGMKLIVSLKGEDTLVATIPGQPEYELIPYQGTEFNLKGLVGFSIEFKLDDAGSVIEAELAQPDGVFTAPKVG
jgi:CubicO group peptidase (beta-lactamase class C family)